MGMGIRESVVGDGCGGGGVVRGVVIGDEYGYDGVEEMLGIMKLRGVIGVSWEWCGDWGCCGEYESIREAEMFCSVLFCFAFFVFFCKGGGRSDVVLFFFWKWRSDRMLFSSYERGTERFFFSLAHQSMHPIREKRC